jgi:hypothetical protein
MVPAADSTIGRTSLLCLHSTYVDDVLVISHDATPMPNELDQYFMMTWMDWRPRRFSGSEDFLTMKQVVEIVQGLQHKLQMMGVPILARRMSMATTRWIFTTPRDYSSRMVSVTTSCFSLLRLEIVLQYIF